MINIFLPGSVAKCYTLLKAQLIGEVGAVLIGCWHILFYADYPILDKLFDLCKFMQTVILHEYHVDSFFLTHTQSPEIISLHYF